MLSHQSPKVGCWYLDEHCQERFEVIAVDEENMLYEIQFFDGSISEIEHEAWQGMVLSEVPAPEDSSGPYELEQDDRLFCDNEAICSFNGFNFMGNLEFMDFSSVIRR